MNLTKYFKKLAGHHVWATGLLLDKHLSHLNDDEWRRDSGLVFGSVHGTLNHLLVADTVWWSRFAGQPSQPIALDAELHADRSELVQALGHAVARWAPWIDTLGPPRFDSELAYTRVNGEAMRLPFAPTLGHVFNHGTHHRGQISAALTAMGKPAPELDWVYQLQEEASAR